MKKTLSSQDLNKDFQAAKEKIDEVEQIIKNSKDEYIKKLMIINYCQEFANNKLDAINAGVVSDYRKTVFYNNTYNNMYDQYCYEIHPKFKTTPIDIFNLQLTSGNTMFKQCVSCKVNDIVNNEYVSLLANESVLNKAIVFDEFHTNEIKLEFQINNNLSTNTSRFNMIEIDPYISGAYTITSIEIYESNENTLVSSTPIKTIQQLDNIGKTRILLSKKYKFNKVVFNFKCNFSSSLNNDVIYPFGIKHILFKEANFRTDSCVIVRASFDDFVEYMYNKITLYTIYGKKDTTCDYYGIEVYTTYENNTLLNRIKLSDDVNVYRIAKNTRNLYLKIPLVNDTLDEKEYLCLNGLGLNISTKDIIII